MKIFMNDCGFIDGEGHFIIKKDTRISKSPFQFEFIINLHCDDIISKKD